MSYIGNAPVVIPVERQVSGVNVGTIVAFPTDHPAPVGYVKSGEKFSKNTYPELFKYLNSETAPNVDNDQVGDIKWFSKRELLDGDYLPADGQLVDNGVKLYPDMWDAICNNEVPTVLEADFISDAHKRGSYTKGDNLSNFRVPDMNGKSLNTLGSVFIRGDGANSADAGAVQGDAIRNIVGGIGGIGGVINRSYSTGFEHATGVFSKDSGNMWDVSPIAGGQLIAPSLRNATFDASTVVPTAPENRPLNIAGCWTVRVKKSKTYYIKAAGFIENEGLAKIGGLVETDSVLQKQIDEMNSWPQSGSTNSWDWVKHKDGRVEMTTEGSYSGAWSAGSVCKYTDAILISLPFNLTKSRPFVQVRDGQVSARSSYCSYAIVEGNTLRFHLSCPPASTNTSAAAYVVQIIGRWK